MTHTDKIHPRCTTCIHHHSIEYLGDEDHFCAHPKLPSNPVTGLIRVDCHDVRGNPTQCARGGQWWTAKSFGAPSAEECADRLRGGVFIVALVSLGVGILLGTMIP